MGIVKLIFLDFDGVLNSAGWFARMASWPVVGFSEAELLSHLDPAAVARLERIIVATGAKCVLSTSWRAFIRPEEAQRLLAAKGAPSVEFVGETPKHYREAFDADVSASRLEPRGAEIWEWLVQQGERAESAPAWGDYVILDDAHCGRLLYERQVHTDFETGLLDEHVTQAVALLGGSHG